MSRALDVNISTGSHESASFDQSADESKLAALSCREA